jgi:hypothetical protein
MRLIWTLLLFIATPLFAVVIIAPQEVGQNPGISGNIGASLQNVSGNTQKQEYLVSGKIQYDNNTTFVTFLQGDYQRLKSKGNLSQDNNFIHYRFLYKFTAPLYAEAFLQRKMDYFQDIQSRYLEGAGARYRFYNHAPYGKMYVGLGAMLDQTNYENPSVDPNTNQLRMNSYIAYTNTINERTIFSLDSYYQPCIDEFGDYYASATAQLQLNIIGQLWLSVLANYAYNSKPAVDVLKTDTSVVTSLLWKF